MAAREARIGGPPSERATRWGLARTTTVIEDQGGLGARVLGALLDRRRWPAIPAVLLVTTLFVLALSGFRPGLPATAVATATPGAATPGRTEPPALTSAPSIVPVESETASAEPSSPPASPTPAPTPPPTPRPTQRPSPTFRTYVVKSGDTLSAIAARYDTTVQAIVDLNNLPDANRLSVGQVLLIPHPG
jgi:LysM repeat protein